MKQEDLDIEFYKRLYLIRAAEEKIIAHYHEDQMKTPMHMSMGSEAISVGVCCALNQQDQVFGTYRSHALYLAKTQNIDNFFAEMFGKDSALLKGIGGSMHLCGAANGFMGTSAIVASAIPVAIGAAFANKINQNGRVVAVFFGDGAIDEGVFWESINVACLMKLPILFICEDNGLAVHAPASQRHGYESITDIISKFKCDVYKEQTTDVKKIYDLTRDAIKSVNRRPSFIHLKYYRYLEHVGVHEDFNAGYRDKKEFEDWRKNDPVELYRARTESKVVEELEKEIDYKVDIAFSKAQLAPFPNDDVVFDEVYHAKD